MRTKINRPVVTIDNKRTEASHMHWYDIGYQDSVEDSLMTQSVAYDVGYENGLEDGRKEKKPKSTHFHPTFPDDTKEQLVHRLEERITRIETCLRSRSEVSNRNGGTI